MKVSVPVCFLSPFLLYENYLYPVTLSKTLLAVRNWYM